jgi:hypothetical protein
MLGMLDKEDDGSGFPDAVASFPCPEPQKLAKNLVGEGGLNLYDVLTGPKICSAIMRRMLKFEVRIRSVMRGFCGCCNDRSIL